MILYPSCVSYTEAEPLFPSVLLAQAEGPEGVAAWSSGSDPAGAETEAVGDGRQEVGLSPAPRRWDFGDFVIFWGHSKWINRGISIHFPRGFYVVSTSVLYHI